MKFRTVKYFLREGFSNVWTNKRMSAASACVVLAVLLLFGTLFLLAINFGNIANRAQDQPLSAFILDSADSNTIISIENSIKKLPGVKSVKKLTKEQGFIELQEKIPEHKELINGLGSAFIPYKMIINLKDPDYAQSVINVVSKIKGVDKVKYDQSTMDRLMKIIEIVRIFLYIMLAVLGMIALFIIMYTIKLTVFSRRREINIMKYVGATDWFIKWPFIIEGIIIGLLGSMVAVIIIIFEYNYLHGVVGNTGIALVQMVPMDLLMKREMFLLFALLGGSIGAIGSVISVRKYLDV